MFEVVAAETFSDGNQRVLCAVGSLEVANEIVAAKSKEKHPRLRTMKRYCLLYVREVKHAGTI